MKKIVVLGTAAFFALSSFAFAANSHSAADNDANAMQLAESDSGSMNNASKGNEMMQKKQAKTHHHHKKHHKTHKTCKNCTHHHHHATTTMHKDNSQGM